MQHRRDRDGWRLLSTIGMLVVAVVFVRGEGGSSSRAAAAAAIPTASTAEVIGIYCTTCHNNRLNTAGLSFEGRDLQRVEAHAEVLEKVLKKVRSDAMPPAGARRPDAATKQAFVATLEQALDRAAAQAPNAGRPAIHRLNRTEYVNAIRDLLGLEINGRSWLPPDDTGYGFDNNADVLYLTSPLLDRYLLAAEKIGNLAVGDPAMRPAAVTYDIPHALVQDRARIHDELPFGSRGGESIRHYFPIDGEYQISLRLQKAGISNQTIRGLHIVTRIDVRIDGARVKVFTLGRPDLTARLASDGTSRPDDDDKALELRLPIKAGTHTVGVAFDTRETVPEGLGPSRNPAMSEIGGNALMALARVAIAGPFNAQLPAEPVRRLFICEPTAEQDALPCAKRILSAFGRRAYRRPVTQGELRRLLAVYEAARRNADQPGTFRDGIRAGLQSVLSNINFLVRVEHEPPTAAPGTPHKISDLELASRLSFFLWSSIPDDELLALAERGRLRDPVVLAHQVRRMLSQDRANGFVKNFFDQWLTTRNVQSARPDTYMFPEFDENLRRAFQRETELFLSSQIREDRNVVELLTADYTFLNERLAKHYEIPGVYGDAFRRVAYPHDRRAGLLGHGSVLLVTSYANRTSPVLRGKWVLETILGTPPPPPPENVPALPEDEPGKAPTSVRERLEQHRRNPVCATCHARLDPLGFAFENFDAVGKWRNEEGRAPVNSSGVFVTGESFANPGEFRKALLSQRDEFAETLTMKILIYALGRGIEYYDMPSVRAIVREAQANEYRWSSLITAIVKSMPFQMRQSDRPINAQQARSQP